MNTHWIIYPIKNFRNNQLASLFSEDLLKTYDELSIEYPQMLGVLANDNGTLIMLNYYIQAAKFIEVSEKETIKLVRQLLDGAVNHLAMKFDDIDVELNEKLTSENPLNIEREQINLPQNKEKIWRLIWEMRVSSDVDIDSSLFVSHGNNISVDMFETGDQVIVWLDKGQQIRGITSKFGLMEGEAVIKVVVTKANAVRYNGGVVDIDVGDTISVPLKSIEKYNPQKAT